jgi:hypothetical protein
MTAECLQAKRRRQGAGEHKTKRKPTALRYLPRSKCAKAQHVQREQGAAYVVKQLVSRKSQVTRVNRLQPLTRNPRTDRHGAFDEKERTQLDPVAAIRPRFATSKTRGCYLMRAPSNNRIASQPMTGRLYGGPTQPRTQPPGPTPGTTPDLRPRLWDQGDGSARDIRVVRG